jgi:hypothetical protein
MKRILLLTILFIYSWCISAQLTPESERFNFELFIDSYTVDEDNDSGTNDEIRILHGILVDSDNALTWLWDWNQIGGTFPLCYEASVDPPNPPSPFNILEYVGYLSNSEKIDFNFQFFENDTGFECQMDNSDDAGQRGRSLLEKNSATGNWKRYALASSQDFNSGESTDFSITYKVGTRYTLGDNFNAPLDFGNMSYSTKSHSNTLSKHQNILDSPFLIPANPGLSYTDQIGLNNPDVFYKFTIGAEGANVKITAPKFDFQTLLFDVNENQITGLPSEGDIELTLCSGQYFLVVDGINANAGEFDIEITTSPIKFSAEGPLTTSISEICADTNIGPITGNQINYLPEGNEATYIWQRKYTIDSEFQNILNIDSKDLLESDNVTIPANENRIYLRRAPFHCSTTGKWSNTIIIEKTDSEISDPGSIKFTENGSNIDFPTPYSVPQGYQQSPGVLKSNTPAQGMPAPITYQWEKFENNTWEIISTSDVLQIPLGLTVNTPFRRKAINDCDIFKYSNTFTINVIPANGVSTGTISAGPNATGAKIPGVEVTVRRLTSVQGENLVPSEYMDVTNTNGTFTITNIYYGPGTADFEVTPSYTDNNGLDHTFEPQKDTITLSAGNTSITSNFQDLTSFTAKGKISQLFEGVDVPVEGVLVQSSGGQAAFTDSCGYYELNIEATGNYTITPSFNGHTFNPPSQTIFIASDTENIDFQDTQMRNLSGVFTDACGNPVEEAQLKIELLTDCESIQGIPEKVVSIPVSTGMYSINLPANKYKVDFESIGPDALEINTQLFENPEIDLTVQDTVLDFIYRAPLSMEVSGLPDFDENCEELPQILEQLESYTINFKIWEGEIGVCPLDTGMILVNENVSLENIPSIEIDEGEAFYTFVAGDPNTNAADLFKKSFEFNASNFAEDGESPGFLQADTIIDVIITGSKVRPSNFVTVSPQIPTLILRDPPGDASYTEVEIGTELITSTLFFAKENNTVDGFAEIKVGTEFETGIGFTTEVDIEATINTSLSQSLSTASTNEMVSTITSTQTFSTNSDDFSIGEGSDVFIGSAINLIYSIADIIEKEANGCRIIQDKDLTVAPTGINSQFVYSQNFIKNTLIPNLRQNAELSMNPDTIRFYNNQVTNWENILQYNEDLKENSFLLADTITNISFDGNTGPQTTTVTTSTQSTESFEFFLELEESIAVEAGLEIAGAGFSGGVTTTFKAETGSVRSKSIINTFSSTVVIDDDDGNDAFLMSVTTDPVYKTPVFKLLSGQSSCPPEAGTSPLDIPDLVIEDAIKTNLDPDSPVEFNLRLYNNSSISTSLPRIFKLGYINSAGGTVTLGGTGQQEIEVPISIQNPVDRVLTLNKGIADSYNLEVYLYPGECSDNTYTNALSRGTLKTRNISAFFNSDCSEVSIFNPIDGWTVKSSDNNILDLHLKDYDKDILEQMIVQYKRDTSNVWKNGPTILKTALNENSPGGANLGTIYPFNVSSLIDGNYDIRVQVNCTNGATYSNHIRGMIERTGPSLLGTPKPKDFVYNDIEDEISARFDEPIDCSMASITFQSNKKGKGILFTFNCEGDKITITPTINIFAATPSYYTIHLSGIKDIYGNLGEEVSWQFSVGDVDKSAQVWFVNASAPSGGLGSSWDDAFNNLEAALDSARTDDQIWLAAGIYYPSLINDLDASGGSDAREATFYINKDIQIYGGFLGNETALEERDFVNNPTIICGNIGSPGSETDNAFHVFFLDGNYGFGLSPLCLLDGITVQNGRADGPGIHAAGGGIYNDAAGGGSSAPTLNNLVIRNNYASGNGGGLFNNGSNSGNANPHINSSLFTYNTAASIGGAITNFASDGNGLVEVYNSVIANNTATIGGGIRNFNADASFINSLFYGNVATNPSWGDAVHMNGSTVNFINSILWNNDNNKIRQFPTAQSNSTINIHHSISEFGTTNFDTPLNSSNVFTSDPSFLDAASLNFRLLNNSPAIDAGTPDTTFLGIPLTDYDGLARLNGTIDIGPFENPFVNCPDVLRIIPQYGDMAGAYAANQMIYIEKGNDTPTNPVSLSAPEIRITSDFTIPALLLFEVDGTGCGQN